MERHYGLKVDDRVRFSGPGGVSITGKIISLYSTDNNGGRMRLDDGREVKIVCEWCEVLPKHERCPTCGEPVDSIFDHVDRDEFCTPPATTDQKQADACRDDYEAFVLRASSREEGLLQRLPNGDYALSTARAGYAAWRGAKATYGAAKTQPSNAKPEQMEIISCHYDFVRHQNHITAISAILGWLGERGFSIVSMTRPPSNNPHYPNLDFVAQRKGKFSDSEAKAWEEIQHYPFSESSYQFTEAAVQTAHPDKAEVERAIKHLSLAADPSDETMKAVRTIRAALSAMPTRDISGVVDEMAEALAMILKEHDDFAEIAPESFSVGRSALARYETQKKGASPCTPK